MSNHQHLCNVGPASDLFQTLDELDFERGIWSAALSGDLIKIRKLVNNGEDINKCDHAGYTALHYAARSGELEVCKFLLSNGANINAITRAGNATALHRAATTGKYSIVELLESKGADLYMQDADGKNALHRAAEGKHVAIYEFLKSKAPKLEAVKDHKSNLPTDYGP